MQGKTVLITGGNAGIGLAAAIDLARQGAEVVIVSRNAQKGEEALQEIAAAASGAAPAMLQADLGSFAQVRQLAQTFLERYPRLDVLINNAGAFFSAYDETEDGIERQFAINHLAPFLLTNLLMECLKASTPARIVNVASRAHYRGWMNFDDIGFKQSYDGFIKAYSQSKLANVLFTKELARKLEGTGITVNCLHPGVVGTSIAQKESKGIYRLGWALMRPFMMSAADGAKTTIYLASSPQVEGVTGEYFDKCKAKPAAKAALNQANARRLWEVSEQLTGMKWAG